MQHRCSRAGTLARWAFVGARLSTFRYNILLHKNRAKGDFHGERAPGDDALISSKIVVFMEAVFYDFGEEREYASA